LCRSSTSDLQLQVKPRNYTWFPFNPGLEPEIDSAAKVGILVRNDLGVVTRGPSDLVPSYSFTKLVVPDLVPTVRR